jgi:hypothetical protein
MYPSDREQAEATQPWLHRGSKGEIEAPRCKGELLKARCVMVESPAVILNRCSRFRIPLVLQLGKKIFLL